MSLDQQMDRLKQIRDKIENINQTKARLSGELDGHMKRKNEIEHRFQELFGFDIKDALSEAQRLEKEAEEHIQKAEELLKQ